MDKEGWIMIDIDEKGTATHIAEIGQTWFLRSRSYDRHRDVIVSTSLTKFDRGEMNSAIAEKLKAKGIERLVEESKRVMDLKRSTPKNPRWK